MWVINCFSKLECLCSELIRFILVPGLRVKSLKILHESKVYSTEAFSYIDIDVPSELIRGEKRKNVTLKKYITGSPHLATTSGLTTLLLNDTAVK